ARELGLDLEFHAAMSTGERDHGDALEIRKSSLPRRPVIIIVGRGGVCMRKQLAAALTVGLIFPWAVVGADVPADDLRPGLVTTYRDGKVEILRHEPVIALALKAGEAAHPRLAAKEGSVRWEGYVNIARPGAYRFSATLHGRFRLTVADKEVLN